MSAAKTQRYVPHHGVGRRARLLAIGRATALVIVIAAGVVMFVVVGEDIRQNTLHFARNLTGGSDAGMAVAAWLMVWLPIGALGIGALTFPQLPAAAVVAWVGAVGLMLLPAAAFMPGRGRDATIEKLIAGPGSAGFAEGLRWSGFGIPLLLAVGVLITVTFGDDDRPGHRRHWWANGLALGLINLGALTVALVRVQ